MLKTHPPAATPHVGIFWFFKGELIQSSVPVTQGEEYGDFINGPDDHYPFWSSIQRGIPDAELYEYDQVPRGRVVYSKQTDTFFVYGSEQFVKDTKQKNAVAHAFELAPKRIVFRADEHYGPGAAMACFGRPSR